MTLPWWIVLYMSVGGIMGLSTYRFIRDVPGPPDQSTDLYEPVASIVAATIIGLLWPIFVVFVIVRISTGVRSR